MTQAHLMGLPVEESLLPLVPVAAVMLTAVAVASRTKLRRLRRLLRHR